jgi:hypothetical protein
MVVFGGKEVTPGGKHTAFEAIIRDFEAHYNNGPEMFASWSNFDEFLNTEVRFHAKMLRVDYEKAKAALLAWVKRNHSEEYLNLA